MLCGMKTSWLAAGLVLASLARAQAPDPARAALERAGENRAQIQAALDQLPENERQGLCFLLRYMPDVDLRNLSAEFLLEHVRFAYRAWNAAPWKDSVPPGIFLNNVLPYANVSERRERWRKNLYERFAPLVKDAKTPGRAAVILNQKIFPALKVRYSTKRRRADQAPSESIETGMASCTGLSILLIDACRAVGVPARFVGTPRWSDNSGNHSWVEVWDDGDWHFTGAAEPSGDHLDRAWFTGRASKAQRDHPLHAIYAVSYKTTPLRFPLVWNRRFDFVTAVNVTDRYTGKVTVPPGAVRVRFRALDGMERCATPVTVTDSNGKVVFTGCTKDERFDANDHVTAALEEGKSYRVQFGVEGRAVTVDIKAAKDEQLVSIELPSDPIPAMHAYLATPREDRGPIQDEPFAKTALSRADADRAARMLARDHRDWIRKTRAKEMKEGKIRAGELEMPFFYRVLGEKPRAGRSLWISLHGGGNTPARVNDRQWEKQSRLYTPGEGVYLAPRAPTNTWDLWHQRHIDGMLARLIENLIAFEDVNPDRVYLLGYSAGGDGVYQLAPRMADRFAAAAMSAGHPNETVPLGLRNLPFTIHVGGKDAAYGRNETARTWRDLLARLAKADPNGYVHWVEIYPDKGHWMGHRDAAALPWMAEFRRRSRPERIVWQQDDVVHRRFYWLALPAAPAKERALVTATRKGQRIELETDDLQKIVVRLDDRLLDLDQDVTIVAGERTLFQGKVARTIDVIARTLAERGDPADLFPAEVEVDLVHPKGSTAGSDRTGKRR